MELCTFVVSFDISCNYYQLSILGMCVCVCVCECVCVGVCVCVCV